MTVTTTPIPVLVGAKVKVISQNAQGADRHVLLLLRGLGGIAEGYAFKDAMITVATSTTVSAAVDIPGYEVVGVIVPTGWTAGNVTFQVDPGDGTFRAVTGVTLVTPTANEVTSIPTVGTTV